MAVQTEHSGGSSAGAGNRARRRSSGSEPNPTEEALGAAWLDTSDGKKFIVCEAANGLCLRMSPSAYWLFARVREGLAPAQIASLIRSSFGSEADPAEVSKACEDMLAKIEEESRIARKKARKRYAFRIRLLPESIVSKIARRFEGLLAVPVAIAFACLLAVAVALLVFSGPSHGVAAHMNSESAFAIAYAVFLLALCAHELGHAAACSRYGIRPGDIGFALYLVFPAVYCDVTRAWLLPRRKRVVVDIAGLAFEVGVGAIYVIIGLVFQLWFFNLAALMVLGNLVWALNPFGRFDIYWTLNDALGITDLRKASWRALKGLVQRHRAADQADAGELRGRARGALIAYAICSALMFGWFAYEMIEIGIALGASLASDVGLAERAGIGPAVHSASRIVLPVVIFTAIYCRMGSMLLPPAVRLVKRRKPAS
jgi:hypothetical protein